MNHLSLLTLAAVAVVCAVTMNSAGHAAPAVTLFAGAESEPVAFGMQELQRSLEERGYAVERATLPKLTARNGVGAEVRVVIGTQADAALAAQLKLHDLRVGDGLRPEGFSLRKSMEGDVPTYWVIGADEAGAMYGGLELAEVVRCVGLNGFESGDHSPYLGIRGIKFNCPLDERTPTYHAHTGEPQTKNVAVMWDLDFWKAYLDDMARFRYNCLSLWNLHPFPSMVRVPGYEDVALDDVQTTDGVLKMTVDEKIAFWREVMRYAASRNVRVYVVTWNIFVLGTEGKYGLTDKASNPTTTDYFRKSVKQMFLTYPDLAGIGLTAGEHMPRMSTAAKEAWAFDTYGKGVLDAAGALPGRKLTLIHRQHQTGVQEIAKTFQDVIDHPDLDFLFSFKYAKAHVMSSTKQPYCEDYVDELGDLKTLWTLRNDSNYYFRWGAPDFVREFIRNLPYEVSAGFYYGSDGYVWGREFLSKEPRTPRQLEMDKHWYHWLLWGRLGYDPDLSDERLTQILGARFPEVSARDLFTAWQSASMVYPLTTGFHWGALDFQWYLEGCFSRAKSAETKSGFHDVNRFISLGTHPGTDNVSIPDYVKATKAGKTVDGTTPLEVAQQLHDHADRALKLLDTFPEVTDPELRQTLTDIRAVAHLGNYYAHKIRGATELALFRATGAAAHQKTAVSELTAGARDWERYTTTALSQYTNPVRLNRVGLVDWNALTAEVNKDIDLARAASGN